jgi:hypothetical protein
MTKAGLALNDKQPPGPPVLSARLADNSAFAFIEMRSPEEADAVMTLSGLPFMNCQLRLGRPKGYVPPASITATAMGSLMGGGAGAFGLAGLAGGPGVGSAIAPPAPGGGMASALGLMGGGSSGGATAAGTSPGASPAPGSVNALLSGAVAAAGSAGAPAAAPHHAAPSPSPDCVLVAGVPDVLTPGQLREILAPFGEITMCAPLPHDRSCVVVRFADASRVQGVLEAMSTLAVGTTGVLRLTRATAGVVAAAQAGLDAASASPPTRILELGNIVIVAELQSPQEVADIHEEVAEECEKSGRVERVYIPPLSIAQRAVGRSASENAASVPVFVVFAEVAAAQKCAAAMRGRKFDQRVVTAAFVTEARLAEVEAQANAAAPGGGGSGGGATGGAQPSQSASSNAGTGSDSTRIRQGEDMEGAEDRGAEGGVGGGYGGVAIPPPAHMAAASGASAAATATASTGRALALPEDNLTLPAVPSAADLD